MGAVTLVDTDVLIAHLRGVDVARGWLVTTRKKGTLHVSAITVTEITGGMTSGERREVWRLLASLDCHPVTELIARRAGEFMRTYHRSHSGIGIADYLIAATAIEQVLSLATLNVRHFPMFPDLAPPFLLPQDS